MILYHVSYSLLYLHPELTTRYLFIYLVQKHEPSVTYYFILFQALFSLQILKLFTFKLILCVCLFFLFFLFFFVFIVLLGGYLVEDNILQYLQLEILGLGLDLGLV